MLAVFVMTMYLHGCFSVTVPQPTILAQIAELTGSIADPRPPSIPGIVPDPEFPPPKHLT
jgi:hypothetical protein